MKRFICIICITVLLLTGCQTKKALPRPDYPLKEEALNTAIEETGLSWSITSTDTYSEGDNSRTSYGFSRPESSSNFQTAFISSALYRQKRMLTMSVMINSDAASQQSWETWKDWIILATRLYGGFIEVEELYNACSTQKLPLNEKTVYAGTLTGGYCQIRVDPPVENWWQVMNRPNTVFIEIFESKEACQEFYDSIEMKTEP